MILKSNWSSDFGHAETGNGAKKRVVLRREFFRSNFKVEWENGVWTKIRFLGSGFLFTCGNFTLIFYCFFQFFGSDFSLNGFPNPFTAHSRPSFLFELNFHFSLGVFLFTCGILILIFCFFLIFCSDVFKMVFWIHSWSILGLVFLFSQWKFFELYVRTCPAMFFTSSNKKMFRFTSFCRLFNILREIFLTSLG